MSGGSIPVFLAVIAIFAAQSVTRSVLVQHDGKAVAGAELTCATAKVVTASDGRAALVVPAEGCTLTVTREGLAPFTLPIKAEPTPIEVTLAEAPEVEEEVIVAATRAGRLASDQALRVEVVNREEIEEKLLMTPGDIVMLLNETSGIRLQATTPALGGASVRIQGLTGRYTSVLTDGLPIHNTQVASLGLLQIPPMDLRQVEVIKGAASALYGAAALGGVINLVTRPPTAEHEGELLVNATSRGGTDTVVWLSGPVRNGWGYTVLGGGHTQAHADVNDDLWADVPHYRRVVVRPRLVANGERGSFELLGGYTGESRIGGFVNGAFTQAVDTDRADAGLAARTRAGRSQIAVRASLSSNRHTHRYGEDSYADRHQTGFAELAVSRPAGRHLLVIGGAVERQSYRNDDLPVFDYVWTTPGLFVQDDWNVHPAWSLSLSARVDAHSEYGTFLSPRVSSLIRVGGWDLRASAGRGFSAPNALTEESEEVGLGRVVPPRGLDAERGISYSVDGSRRLGILDVSMSMFASRIDDALAVNTAGSMLVLANRPGATETAGAEIFGRLRHRGFVVTASHVWTRATEVEVDGRRVPVPLTPHRTWAVVAAWERHGVARVGVEIYRTGSQWLDDNPYDVQSAAYTIVGVLAERRIGRYRLFVNFENLTDVRQTNFSPLLRPAPSPTGRYTVDAWAPLDGRTVNAGLRVLF